MLAKPTVLESRAGLDVSEEVRGWDKAHDVKAGSGQRPWPAQAGQRAAGTKAPQCNMPRAPNPRHTTEKEDVMAFL